MEIRILNEILFTCSAFYNGFNKNITNALCLINDALWNVGVLGSEGIADLVTRQKSVVSFTPGRLTPGQEPLVPIEYEAG